MLLCSEPPPRPTTLVDSPTPTNPVGPSFPAFYKRQQSSAPKELCEKLGRKIRRAGLVRDHQIWTLAHGMMVYKNAFKGEDFVAWLGREQNLSRDEALDKGQWLIEHRVVERVGNSGGDGGAPRTPTTATPTPAITSAGGGMENQNHHTNPFSSMFSSSRSFSTDRYYRLVDDDYEKRMPLNGPDECSIELNGNGNGVVGKQVNAAEFNRRLCEVADRIYAAILSDDKRRVHLDMLDECEAFSLDYMALARDAAHLDIGGASERERLALFINMHNMMLVHITFRYGLPGTIWQRRKYLYSTYYIIGGHLYSLQSIFNGILRGNRKGQGMLWKPFGEQDYRNEFTIRGGEPLTHFGLNNYTRSTPPIRTYSTENVYEELRANARECLGTKEFLQVDLKTGKVLLAKLFKQYSEDFGLGPDDALKWLVRQLEPSCEQRAQLAKLIYTKNYALAFLPADTDLNMSYGVAGTQNGGVEENGQEGGGGEENGRRGWTTVSNVEIQDEDFCCDDD